jgi:hypothetical protein
MERIARARSSTLTHTFYVDGVATNPTPDTATVTVTRADGTALYTNAATTDAGVGAFSFTLTPTDTALLDRLTVGWTATFGNQLQTVNRTVEVAGDFLFAIIEAQAIKLGNTTLGSQFTVAKIVEMRTLVEMALEDACGVAFVPRYERERVSADGYHLRVKWPKVRAVRSASHTATDGTTITALTSTELASVVGTPGGLYYPNRWTTGWSNMTVGYEHGYDTPPPRISRAGLLLTKRWLLEGPVDDRATSLSTDDGTFLLVTPGMRGAMFDLPEVNAAVQQYDHRPVFA